MKYFKVLKNKYLIIFLFVIFASLFIYSGQKKNNISTEIKFSNPSRFGILTSSRWVDESNFIEQSLTPVSNNNPFPEVQPHRDQPRSIAISADGRKAYIALEGKENTPGHEVVVFDISSSKVIKKIPVGSSPFNLALHPKGRFLVVINRFSNFASVIDTEKDKVVSNLPLDFYCQEIIFTKDGRKAFVSNRYLGQVFLIDLDVSKRNFSGKMRILGGYKEDEFFSGGKKSVYETLQRSCGTMECHGTNRRGFYAGKDKRKAFFSSIENSSIGDPDNSLLLRSIRPVHQGGFANDRGGPVFHAAGVIFEKNNANYKLIESWIANSKPGPGIPVGNFGAKPRGLALNDTEKYLYVGNMGNTNISIIDTDKQAEVAGIYTQSLILGLKTDTEAKGGKELLIALSLGAGFGAAK